MVNTLVLGAGGALGARCVRELLKCGGDVAAALRPGPKQVRLPLLDGASLIDCDVAIPGNIARAIQLVRPGSVVLAYRLDASKSIQGTHEVHSVFKQLKATYSELWSALHDIGFAGQIVYLGSSTCYGGYGTYKTTDPLQPVSYYGEFKALEAELLQAECDGHGFPFVELRIFSAYGPWMSPTRLISALLRCAITGDTLPLSGASICRDLVHQEDIAIVCRKIISGPMAHSGVINLGSGQLTSIAQIAEQISDLAGRTLFYIDSKGKTDPLRGGACADTSEESYRKFVELRNCSESFVKMLAWARTESGRAFLTDDANR